MHGGSSARFPTKPTEKLKIEKMYAIKQIKICAEYRDMLPRPRLDLSGTPGLRPIGLSPGSWQTSLGLGSMSRYSAQILIRITYSSYVESQLRTHTVHEWCRREHGNLLSLYPKLIRMLREAILLFRIWGRSWYICKGPWVVGLEKGISLYFCPFWTYIRTKVLWK